MRQRLTRAASSQSRANGPSAEASSVKPPSSTTLPPASTTTRSASRAWSYRCVTISVIRSRALAAVPVAWIVAVTVVDVLAPPHIHLGPLLVAAPALTPSFGGPRTVGAGAALAVIAQTVIGVVRDPAALFSANREAQIIALILVGVSLVVFCVLRERRAKELEQVRYVSEAAQRVVLPPLPRRLGPLRTASLYLAAPRPRFRSAATCTRPCAPPPAPG